MRPIITTFAVSAALAAVLAVGSRAGAARLTAVTADVIPHVRSIDRLPHGAVDAIESRFPGGVIVDVDRPDRAGDRYEAEVLTTDVAIHELRIDDAGVIVTSWENRRETDRLRSLPDAIRIGIERDHPGAIVYEAEFEDRRTPYWEVDVLIDRESRELKYRSDGMPHRRRG